MFWGENRGFLDCFRGTKVATMMCAQMIKMVNKTNEVDMDVWFLSEEHNIQTPCLFH